MMNYSLVILSDLTVYLLFILLILILAGVCALLAKANHFTNMLRTRKEAKMPVDSKDSQQWSAEIRTKLIESIEHGTYEDMNFLDELEELTNFDGAVPALSMIEVNIVELIMSYRREILHETRRETSVRIQTAMSPQSRAILDTVVFRQLMMNLLRICAKRTEMGRITIEYEWENDGLRFKIEDSGSPVSNTLSPKLFTDELTEDFIPDQERQVTVTKLKICKIIVDSMHGTISAKPGTNNVGLIFDFWIPCKVKMN